MVVRAVAQPRRQAAPASSEVVDSSSSHASLLAAGALLAPFALDVTASLAAGGEYGLLEGRWVTGCPQVWHRV